MALRRVLGFSFVVLGCAAAGCSASGSTSPYGYFPSDGAAPDAGGEAEAPKATAAECLTDVPCADNADCVALAGTRCNRALAEPRCQKLQCSNSGAACSDPALCKIGMLCIDAETFGEDTSSLNGKCMTKDEGRTVCKSRCSGAEQEGFCGGGQVAAMCAHACDLFPDGWKPDCTRTFSNSVHAFSFLRVVCTSPTSCQLDLDCTNTEHFSLMNACN
jgi:hypothetical protein